MSDVYTFKKSDRREEDKTYVQGVRGGCVLIAIAGPREKIEAMVDSIKKLRDGNGRTLCECITWSGRETVAVIESGGDSFIVERTFGLSEYFDAALDGNGGRWRLIDEREVEKSAGVYFDDEAAIAKGRKWIKYIEEDNG
jgi:hypothetical protein